MVPAKVRGCRVVLANIEACSMTNTIPVGLIIVIVSYTALLRPLCERLEASGLGHTALVFGIVRQADSVPVDYGP